MKTFTIYDGATGKILRNGSVMDDDEANQVEPGESIAWGIHGNWRTERVEIVSGVLTIVPIVVPDPTLAELKIAALAKLAARRWEVETGGVLVGESLIATDRESQATLNGALTYLSLGIQSAVKWKTDTGVFVDADLSTIRAFAQAVGRHVQLCFERESVLSAAIDAAAGAQELAVVCGAIPGFWE